MSGAVCLSFQTTETELRNLLPKLHEKEIYPSILTVTDRHSNDTGKRIAEIDVFYFSYDEVMDVVAQLRELDIDPEESDYPDDYF